MTIENSGVPPKKEKLFQLFSIPGWLALIIELLHFTEDVMFLRENFPGFITFIQRLAPEKPDVSVLMVSVVWILAFLILGPILAERIGTNKTFVVLFVPLILVCLGIGIHRGMQQVDEENRQYQRRSGL